MVKIEEFMAKDVVSCSADATIKDIANRMKGNSVGVIVITDQDKKIMGIVSERDIINKVVSAGLDPDKTLAEDVMTKDVITGNPDMTDVEVASVFSEKGIKKLPIIENGKVIGIVTQTDLLKILSMKWAL